MNMTTEFPDHEEFLSFAERLANTSGAMLMAVIEQAPDVDIKSDASFVTTTDKAVEQKLREMITRTYPDHGILGEEFDNVNIDAEFVWVLDPIDGTAAFVAGIPVYGTLIGLAWNGKPFVGIIDHPVTSDRWVGVSDRFAKHNGKAIKVRNCDAFKNAYTTCSSPDFMTPEQHLRFTKLRKQAQYVQYGGSCFAYGTLASGRTDIAIDCGLEAFDVYACAAVITGAGGYMTDWEGNDITFNMNGTVIASGDHARLEELIDLLQTG